MLTNKKIGMIGTGNMGNALIDGLIRSGAALPENIICSDASKRQLEPIRQKHKVTTTTDNIEVVSSATSSSMPSSPKLWPACSRKPPTTWT